MNQNRQYLLNTLILLILVCRSEAELRAATLTIEHHAKIQCLNSQYWVDQPNTQKENPLPLVIYLHGAGGKGSEINKIHGRALRLTKAIKSFGKGPCIIVTPQCMRNTKTGDKGTWKASDLNIFLQHLKTTLPIDSRRIYLTGNSMGGYGTWSWGSHSPQHFAALAPVAGGLGADGPKDVTPALKQWAASLVKVPLYAFVGAKDRVVPAKSSERMVEAIRKAGGKLANIKVFPEAGHNVGKIVFNSREYYDWMFAQKQSSLSPKKLKGNTAQ